MKKMAPNRTQVVFQKGNVYSPNMQTSLSASQ